MVCKKQRAGHSLFTLGIPVVEQTALYLHGIIYIDGQHPGGRPCVNDVGVNGIIRAVRIPYRREMHVPVIGGKFVGLEGESDIHAPAAG